MNFLQFKIAYGSFIFILKLCMFLIFILWAKNSYNYFEANQFFSFLNDFSKIEKNLSQIWEILKPWIIDTAWIILKITIIKYTISLIKKIPIMPKWLSYWDSIGDINPIAGRFIAEYLRNNNRINFMTIIDLHNFSIYEKTRLQNHSKNEHLNSFFKKYDPNFEKDITVTKEQ